MTDQHPENNRVLHELFGKCWHEYFLHPNYADDPRLVLEGMARQKGHFDFLFSLWEQHDRNFDRIIKDIILDKTGRLRDLAIEFFKQEGK